MPEQDRKNKKKSPKVFPWKHVTCINSGLIAIEQHGGPK
jgi:hypothetical protein